MSHLKKKIVFVHLHDDFSGSPKVLKQVIEGFMAENYDCHVLTGNSMSGFLSNLNLTHHKFFYRRTRFSALNFIFYLYSQISLFLLLIKYFKSDFILYINTMLPFGGALAGFLLRNKIVYHIHETSLKPFMFKAFLRIIINFTAHKVIFVSNYLHKIEGFNKKKQRTIYNSLSKKFVKEAEKYKRSYNSSNKFIVIMVCSLRLYKGILEFFSIAQSLINFSRIEFKLVLNANKSEIDKFLISFPMPKNIKIINEINDVSSNYKTASLLLNLSRVDEWVETFGLTIAEGMAYGIPAIVPPIGGPTEIVTKDVHGFHISSYNKNEIVDKIIFLYNNPETMKVLSLNCKKKSLEFNEDNFKQKIIDFVSFS